MIVNCIKHVQSADFGVVTLFPDKPKWWLECDVLSKQDEFINLFQEY